MRGQPGHHVCRNQSIDAMSAQLERAGFAPPGNDPDAWSNLARVIGIDPNDRTAREIYDEALAWVERIRVRERIRRAVNNEPIANDVEWAD